MLVGLGIDVVGVARIARALEADPDALPRQLLVAEERVAWERLPLAQRARHLAARFAAKEAAIKALAAGPGDLGYFREIVVEAAPGARPALGLRGRMARLAAELGVRRTHLTLTHTRDLAAAAVALES